MQTDGGDDFPGTPHYTVDAVGGLSSTGNDFANFMLIAIRGSTLEDRTGVGIHEVIRAELRNKNIASTCGELSTSTNAISN